MRRKWLYASAAAIIGAATLLISPLASRAPAGELLPTYQAHGIAKGLDVTFAPRPSIFDPLLEFAAGYAETKIDSSGGGAANALASAFYPGSLILGARGCDGVPGTDQAAYPPDSNRDPAKRCSTRQPKQEETVLPCWKETQQLADACNAILFNPASPLRTEGGKLKAQAILGSSHGSATMHRTGFTPSPDVSIIIDSLVTTSDSILTSVGLHQEAVTRAAGIHIAVPSLRIDIDSLISRTVSVSTGDEAIAEAMLTFGSVTVTLNGQKYQGLIDNKGVHIHGTDANQTLSLSSQHTLNGAGLDVRAGGPVEIEDAGHAESSVGGLLISFETGRPPAVPLPPLPTPLPTIPNRCFGNSPPPVPIPSPFPTSNPLAGFCLGQGVLPVPPGNSATSLSIGGADAIAVAAHGFIFNPTLPTLPPLNPGNFTGGIPSGPGPVITGPGATSAPVVTTQPAPQQGPLLGLVAKLPSSALVVAGLFFLILALGIAWVPSLRP